MAFIRHVLFFSLLTLLPLAATAQKKLKKPLEFVPADSVVLWGESYNDLRGMALQVDKRLSAKSIEPFEKDFKQHLKTWKKEMMPALTLSGINKKDDSSSPIFQSSQLVNLSSSLFLNTGESSFIDVTERTLWGDLLKEVLKSTPTSFEKHTAAQTLVDATATLYATDGEDIWVNFFTNSTTHIITPSLNLIVDQMTGMPLEGRVKIRLTGYKTGRFHVRLHIRIPGWAVGNYVNKQKFSSASSSADNKGKVKIPTFYVNGRETLTSVVKQGYFVIDRTWNTGDEVLFELPMNAQRIKVHNTSKEDASGMSLQRGPLLYTSKDPSDGFILDNQTALEENYDEDGIVIFNAKNKAGKTAVMVPYITSK